MSNKGRKVLINKTDHVCHDMVGYAVPAYEGENLRQEFKNMLKVTFNDHARGINSCIINRFSCITL